MSDNDRWWVHVCDITEQNDAMVLSYLTLSDRIIGPIWSNWLHWIKDNFIFIPSVNRHSVESWDLADSASHTGNYDWLQQILWPLIGLPVILGETNGLRWYAPAMSACRTRCDLRSPPSRTNPNFQLTADLIPLQTYIQTYQTYSITVSYKNQ